MSTPWKGCFFSLLWVGSFNLLAEPATPACQQGIHILYHERIPYMQLTPRGITGLTASVVSDAFQLAGVNTVWKEIPPKRQLQRIKSDRPCECALGWFKTPERERYAKYSLPIYQDKPQVALVKSSNYQFTDGQTLPEVLSNPNLKLLVRDGYSYGQFIDEKLRQYHPSTKKVAYDNFKMLELIYYRRYDYFFIAPEEIKKLIQASAFQYQDFKSISFSDIPHGEKRYLICGMGVPDRILQALNQTLTDTDQYGSLEFSH